MSGLSEPALWSDLSTAWQATGATGTGQAGDARWVLLQDEARTRVLRLETPGRSDLVLKIYAVPARLAWRTLGMVSRANREFTVMMNAHRQGLPVARPRWWCEERRLGGLRFSALTLDAIDGANLEAVLDDAATPEGERLRLAGLAGDVLGRMHRAGLQWATATPRNLLLTSDEGGTLRAIDFPYATLAAHSIVSGEDALLDLECLLRMSDGRLAFDDEARQALLLAYCDGDAAAADAVDRRIVLRSHLSWKGRRLRRRVRHLLRPGSRSPGHGGVYDAASGSYRRVEDPAVIVPD